jgi:hypothetical protein
MGDRRGPGCARHLADVDPVEASHILDVGAEVRIGRPSRVMVSVVRPQQLGHDVHDQGLEHQNAAAHDPD